MDASQLIQTLSEAFIALSDEIQPLIDRKTILEHKLRYAHEQYQYLADKYAPAVQDVSETLAKLQLPPELEHPLATATSAVPLPRRGQPGSSQHQIALLIREGRKAAQQLIGGVVKADREGDAWSGRGKPVSLYMEAMPSVSTALEKDFTVQGKKGALACPFSTQPSQAGSLGNGAEQVENPHDPADAADPTPHRSSDPICAAMLEDVASAPAPAASKCPIRFLDKHSPEEIAHYIETHKHDIPRSHEVCVRRYQRNEEQIRKFDAKYGNLVSMVKDLSNLHRPMLPPSRGAQNEVDGASNKRVEDWAQTVVAGDPDAENEPPVDEKRESHFDRPLRDVRVGESPSRPWGISVPLAADAVQQRGLSPARAVQDPPQAPRGPVAPRRCPFDHSKLGLHEAVGPEHGADAEVRRARAPAEKDVPPSTPQPTFVNLPDMPSATAEKDGRPQIVFNISGPVFIGYPMEQAIEFLKRSQGQ